MKKFFTLIAVAVLAFAAQANELTVGEGLSFSNVNPICGLYADTEGCLTQTVYPATMLTDMAGNEITAVTFYTLNWYYETYGGYTSSDETDFINFEDAKFQLAIKEVDENGFTEAVAFVGATAVATCVPEYGDTEVTFVLDQPFAFTGKSLVVEVTCIEAGSWGQTYFFGSAAENNCSYFYIPGGGENGEDAINLTKHMPMATFTYQAGTTPVDPTETCAKPEGSFENGFDFHGVTVTLINNETAEGTTLHYNITKDGEMIVENAIYDEPFALTEDGEYYIDFWAEAPGMNASTHGGLIFTIDPTTGLSELLEGKTVAGVRYFNLAGQEMQQAEGLTIVVTTYTDGTSSAVKVVK